MSSQSLKSSKTKQALLGDTFYNPNKLLHGGGGASTIGTAYSGRRKEAAATINDSRPEIRLSYAIAFTTRDLTTKAL